MKKIKLDLGWGYVKPRFAEFYIIPTFTIRLHKGTFVSWFNFLNLFGRVTISRVTVTSQKEDTK